MAQADPFGLIASGLPPEIAAQARGLTRQQAIAEALIQQGQTPIDPNRMAGGYVVPISPWEGLAKVGQAYFGRQAADAADKKFADLGSQYQNLTASEISRYMARKNGVPASSEQIIDEQANGGEGAPATINAPAVGADPRAAVMEAMVSRNPMLQKLAGLDYAEMAKRSAPVKLGKDDRLVDPITRQPIIDVAAQPPKYHVVGGNLVAEPKTPEQVVKPVYTAPKEDELARALEAAGVDPKSPEAVALFKARAEKIATHAPPTRVNVNQSLTTEKKYGEQFASNIAKADSEMRDAAIKAPALAERANMVKKILADGNVITGFGADFRLSADKALALAGVKGADGSAANTETLASGLAQNTLDAIKASGLGSGNGFSNADRDFLEKAVGGKITLEKATMDRLANLAHRSAEQTALRWSNRVKEIPASALEGTGIKVEPVVVPPLFGASKGAPGSSAGGWSLVR